MNFLDQVLKRKKKNLTQIWLFVPMWDTYVALHLQNNAHKRKQNVPDTDLNLGWGLDSAWETELAYAFQSVHNICIPAYPLEIREPNPLSRFDNLHLLEGF